MKRCITLIAVVVLASFAISGIALAKAQVQKLLPYPFDIPRDADASGMAIVNWPSGDVTLVITVSVKGLEPETEYQVKSCTSEADMDWTDLGTFTTNKNGNGHWHKNYRDPVEDLPPTGYIYINIEPGTTVLMPAGYD